MRALTYARFTCYFSDIRDSFVAVVSLFAFVFEIQIFLQVLLSLQIEPMMDETPDEYIARREELIYGRGLCENENKAYCEQWKAYCDQPAFFINENRYKMFVNKMCTAACNRCK